MREHTDTGTASSHLEDEYTLQDRFDLRLLSAPIDRDSIACSTHRMSSLLCMYSITCP